MTRPDGQVVSFTYDALGNVATVTSPGPNGTTTTTYNYKTGYNGYTQDEALGQPVDVTVSGPNASSVMTTTDIYHEYYTSGPNTGLVKGPVAKTTIPSGIEEISCRRSSIKG